MLACCLSFLTHVLQPFCPMLNGYLVSPGFAKRDLPTNLSIVRSIEMEPTFDGGAELRPHQCDNKVRRGARLTKMRNHFDLVCAQIAGPQATELNVPHDCTLQAVS